MLSISKSHQSVTGKVITAIRILLGLFFVLSGLAKIWSLSSFTEVLYSYVFLPEILILIFSYIIPAVEVLLGAFLLMEYRSSTTSFILLLMVFGFTLAAFWTYQNGQMTDCGCFGTIIERKNDWTLFVGNTALMGLLGFLFYQQSINTDK